MTVKRIEIPQLVDAPLQILIWEIDELAPFFVMMMMGMVLERLFIFLILGYLAIKYYRRFRDGRPDGIMYHALYWSGVISPRGRTVRNSFERLYVG